MHSSYGWRRGSPRNPRSYRHSAQPDHGGCEVDEAQEVDGTPVIAGGEAPEVFELAEAALDAVARAVGGDVVGDQSFSRPVGRDDCLSAEVGDDRAQGVRVIGFVGQHGLGPEAFKQGRRGERIATLAGGEDEADWPPEGVGGHVDLGGQSASGAPQSLIRGPPFPVAACWWARTKVLSIIR